MRHLPERDLHRATVQRNVRRDLRHRYADELAAMPEDEARGYLATASRRYADAFAAKAWPPGSGLPGATWRTIG
jgi:hypothetical protein